jgi:RHS repeat-associated protein
MLTSSKHPPNRVGIRNTSDYSPFGVELDGRTVSLDGYRFGYQGSEKDNEFKGDWNSYTTEFRQLDPRLGRWLSVDPLESEFSGISPYANNINNPLNFTDSNGDSPISLLAKWIIKKGAKVAMRKYIDKQIIGRFKRYMSKEIKAQLEKDLLEVFDQLNQEWWETAIEFIPVAGDIYGAGVVGVKISTAWRKMQDIENKYVDIIYKSLPVKKAEKFLKNKRKNGVMDARKDQKFGLQNGEQYIGNGQVDGHHIKPVKEDLSLSTDPSNIVLLNKQKHQDLHKGKYELSLEEKYPGTQNTKEVIISRTKTYEYERPK